MAEVIAALVFAAALFAVLRICSLTIIPAVPRMAALLHDAGRADGAGVMTGTVRPTLSVRATHGLSRPNCRLTRPIAVKSFAT